MSDDDYVGRAAWPPKGVGGTLRKDRTTGKAVPGPYYMRPTKGVKAPGKAADDVLEAGGIPDLNEHAVWYGVLAIKTRLTELGLPRMGHLAMDGIYGSVVRDGVMEFQASRSLVADGVVGPTTARELFIVVLRQIGVWSKIGSTIGCGVVTNESAWDPGAVGKVDSEDHGLAQLNGPSQGFTLAMSFHVRTAFYRLFAILDSHLDHFNNVDDAIAAYNLGRYGCEAWIKEGRPQMWIPVAQRNDPNAVARDVHAYIERIKTSCK